MRAEAKGFARARDRAPAEKESGSATWKWAYHEDFRLQTSGFRNCLAWSLGSGAVWSLQPPLPLATKPCARWQGLQASDLGLQELLDLEPGVWSLQPPLPSLVPALPGSATPLVPALPGLGLRCAIPPSCGARSSARNCVRLPSTSPSNARRCCRDDAGGEAGIPRSVRGDSANAGCAGSHRAGPRARPSTRRSRGAEPGEALGGLRPVSTPRRRGKRCFLGCLTHRTIGPIVRTQSGETHPAALAHPEARRSS